MAARKKASRKKAAPRAAAKPAPAPPPEPKGWTAKTIAETARFLGLVPRQFQNYLERGCPGRNGAYPLDQIVQWARQNVWTTKPEEELSADAERKALENQLLRLKVRNAAKELISRAAAKAAIEILFNRLRARLLEVPAELALELPPALAAELVEVLRNRMQNILIELTHFEDQDLGE